MTLLGCRVAVLEVCGVDLHVQNQSRTTWRCLVVWRLCERCVVVWICMCKTKAAPHDVAWLYGGCVRGVLWCGSACAKPKPHHMTLLGCMAAVWEVCCGVDLHVQNQSRTTWRCLVVWRLCERCVVVWICMCKTKAAPHDVAWLYGGCVRGVLWCGSACAKPKPHHMTLLGCMAAVWEVCCGVDLHVQNQSRTTWRCLVVWRLCERCVVVWICMCKTKAAPHDVALLYGGCVRGVLWCGSACAKPKPHHITLLGCMVAVGNACNKDMTCSKWCGDKCFCSQSLTLFGWQLDFKM